MDSNKAANILSKFQGDSEDEDVEDFLKNLKANKGKSDLKSFDEIADKEMNTVNKRMLGGKIS